MKFTFKMTHDGLNEKDMLSVVLEARRCVIKIAKPLYMDIHMKTLSV